MNIGKAKIPPSKRSLPELLLLEHARPVPLWWREVVRMHKGGTSEADIARHFKMQHAQIAKILDQPAARFLRGRCITCRMKIPMAQDECNPCQNIRVADSGRRGAR